MNGEVFRLRTLLDRAANRMGELERMVASQTTEELALAYLARNGNPATIRSLVRLLDYIEKRAKNGT